MRELIKYIEDEKMEVEQRQRVDGRLVKRKSVGDDKLVNVSSIAANSVGEDELRYEEIAVNVAVGQTSGTGTCTSGSVIFGFRPAGNVDQLVDNITLSGTTITITLAAAATAQNNIVVICIKA